jgi:hypothetical protein
LINKADLKNKWISCNFIGEDVKKIFVELLIDFCSYNSDFRVGGYFCLHPALENVFIDLKTLYNTYNKIKNDEHFPNLAINYTSFKFVKNNEPITIELDRRFINKFDRFFENSNSPTCKVIIERNELVSLEGNIESLIINTKSFSVELKSKSIKTYIKSVIDRRTFQE